MPAKKRFGVNISLCLVMILMTLAACGTAPEATQQVVTQVVKETVMVEGTPQVVEKEVTRVVEVEKETVVTATPEPVTEQVIRVPLSRLGGSIDPSLSYGQGYEFLYNLFDGLTMVDYATGELVPAVAETWDVSADSTVYTFHLREGLEWSDGTPVTAGDFEYAWKRTLDPATQSPTASSLYDILGAEAFNVGESTDPESVGVKALDDLTLEVTLAGTKPTFPHLVSDVAFFPLPRWTIEENGTEGDAWMKPENIVVNGPYTIETLEPDEQVVLVRNENYKGESQPAIDKAIWVLFEEYMSQSLLAFEAGDLDMAWVSGNDLERVREDPELSKMLQEYEIAATCFATFDTSNPPFDDPKVRQAFSLAIDRETLAEVVFKGMYAPADTAAPTQVVGYTPDAAVAYDPEKAKELLAEAGYPGGEGMREIVAFGSSGSEWALLSQALQTMWQDTLGVQVKLDLMESKALSAYVTQLRDENLNYDIRVGRRITVMSSDPAGWYTEVFDPRVDWLLLRWQNERFVTLLDEGRFEQDAEKQRQIYEEAEMIIAQDSPVMPLYHTLAHWVVQPYVKGLAFPVESAAQVIGLRPVSTEAH